MLPEVAYIKLAWALGARGDDAAGVRKLMTTPMSDDMTDREPPDGYIVLQGGVPEMRTFLGQVWS